MINVNLPRVGIRHIQRGQIGSYDGVYSYGYSAEVNKDFNNGSDPYYYKENGYILTIPLSGFLNANKMIVYLYLFPTRGITPSGEYDTYVGTKSYESSSYIHTKVYPANSVILFNMTETELKVRDTVSVIDRHTTNPENYHYTLYYHPFSYKVIEFY